MNFSFAVIFVSLSFPFCCLAGHSLLGNVGTMPSSSLPSADLHKNGFGRQSSVPKSSTIESNLGIVSIRKLSSSKSLKLNAKLGNERPILAKAHQNVGILQKNFDLFPQPKIVIEQQLEEPVPFARYWDSVLDHFDGKVPASTIAYILCRMISAFKRSNGNYNDYDVITTKIEFNDILTPEHFFAVKPRIGSTYPELPGRIELVVKEISVPNNVKLAYMSPEQVLKRNTNFSTDKDIVWSFGVMLFTMLTNRHPLQALADVQFNLAQQKQQQDGNNNNNNISVDIRTMLAESTEDMASKWRLMVSSYVQSGEELPIDLLRSPQGLDHDRLFPVLKSCLEVQTRLLSLCRLSKVLEEIVKAN